MNYKAVPYSSSRLRHEFPRNKLPVIVVELQSYYEARTERPRKNGPCFSLSLSLALGPFKPFTHASPDFSKYFVARLSPCVSRRRSPRPSSLYRVYTPRETMRPALRNFGASTYNARGLSLSLSLLSCDIGGDETSRN